MECPNCGCSFFYCCSCGEPCDSDGDGTTIKHGKEYGPNGEYICDDCLALEKDNDDTEDNSNGD